MSLHFSVCKYMGGSIKCLLLSNGNIDGLKFCLFRDVCVDVKGRCKCKNWVGFDRRCGEGSCGHGRYNGLGYLERDGREMESRSKVSTGGGGRTSREKRTVCRKVRRTGGRMK